MSGRGGGGLTELPRGPRVRSRPGRPRVAVIGGGAAGTLTAVHLMREAGEAGVEIVLIDRDSGFGAGVAYGTTDPQHLLNVAACRMGAIAGHPEHFHEWVRRQGGSAPAEAFLPRGLYGRYLRELIEETETAAAGHCRLTRLLGEVVSLAEPAAPGASLELELAGGERLAADRAVLALGPLPGGDPISISAELLSAGVYVSDPWAPGALDAARDDESVLILGTGLSMVDVALSLGRGEHGPDLRAVSRNGLAPQRHREDLTRIQSFPVPTESGELAPILAAVFEQIGRAGRDGGDWRDVLDSMRSATPDIWRSLRLEEKRRFLATLNRFWDIHRFRMAPEVANRFADLKLRGRLRVDACSVALLEPSGRGARVSLRPAGGEAVETIDVDRVVNCTGAGTDLARQAPPLLAGLLAAGTARADELGLGLDVDPSGALLNASGHPSNRIHVVGALRKGVEWEAIGITEIRDHAAGAARGALASAAEKVAT
jgi:uncharacterized NAD(P)/FAD-binding protein YdhS